MSIKNRTKKTILVGKVRIAKTFVEKAQGLLGTSKPEVLLIKTRFGIHTFGMKYAIDVIVIDKQDRVIKLKKSLPPNRIFLWNPKYDTAVEMPEQIIEKTHTELGDKIDIS